MNNRIKELAEQAGITTNLDTDFFEKDPNKWVDYFSEKFAVLIMRETFDWVVENVGLMEDTEWQSLKRHFGVEE